MIIALIVLVSTSNAPFSCPAPHPKITYSKQTFETAEKEKEKDKDKDKAGASSETNVVSGKGGEKNPTALTITGGLSPSLSPRSELIARALSLAVGDKVRQTHHSTHTLNTPSHHTLQYIVSHTISAALSIPSPLCPTSRSRRSTATPPPPHGSPARSPRSRYRQSHHHYHRQPRNKGKGQLQPYPTSPGKNKLPLQATRTRAARRARLAVLLLNPCTTFCLTTETLQRKYHASEYAEQARNPLILRRTLSSTV